MAHTDYYGQAPVYSGLDSASQGNMDRLHLHIDTEDDGKNVRINSRNVVQATGDHTAVQIKPNKSVTGTGSITGLEVSPRFAASMGGNDLRAILADPLLKAGSGNIGGQVVAVEANIDFGTSGTRTITGDISAFSSFLAIPSTGMTYSGLISFLRVRTVNIKGWDCFLNLDDANVGLVASGDKTGGTNSYYLKVRIGATEYAIQLYTV